MFIMLWCEVKDVVRYPRNGSGRSMTMGDVYGRNGDADMWQGHNVAGTYNDNFGKSFNQLERVVLLLISLRQKISVCSLLHVSLIHRR